MRGIYNKRVVTIKKLPVILIMLGVLFFSPAFLLSAQEYEEEVSELIDLRGIDWTRDVINLDGTWEFFWEELLTPEDFNGEQLPNLGLIEVPGAWNRLELNGETLPRAGYGTYRGSFLLDETGQLMGLKVPRILDSYRLWVNGVEVASAGELGRYKEQTLPQSLPQTAFFQPEGDTLELIVQVASFENGRAGIVESLKLGRAESIISLENNKLAYDFFLLGGLLVFGFYHLFLFLFRKNRFSLLYFGIFCLLLGLRAFFAGEGIFFRFAPDFSWAWAQKIESLTYFLGIGAVALFYKKIFPRYLPRIWIILSLSFTAVFSLIVLFVPPGYLIYFRPFFHIVYLLLGVLVLRALSLGTWKKQPGAALILTGAIVLVFTGIHDFLYLGLLNNSQPLFSNPVLQDNLFNAGLLLFIFTSSLGLGSIGVENLSEQEKIVEKLQETNEDLEFQVIGRIKEIEQSNDKIEQQEGEIAQAHKALEKVSLRDPLTEAWNRRYLNEMLVKEWEKGLKNKIHLSILFLDIDDFQVFNQKYGHRVGDDLLIKISRILTGFSRRPGEIVSRYGGGEFVFLLPQTTQDRAMEIGERIRRKVEGLYLFQESSRGYKPVTVSIGIATAIPDESSIPESLIAQAENAMFRAKKEGKNQIATDFFFGE